MTYYNCTMSGMRSNEPGRAALLCCCSLMCCWMVAGDGIGPDIAEAVKTVFSAAKAPIVWEEQIVGTTVDSRTNSMVSRENLDSVLVSVASSAVPRLLHSAR